MLSPLAPLRICAQALPFQRKMSPARQAAGGARAAGLQLPAGLHCKLLGLLTAAGELSSGSPRDSLL